MFYNFILQTAPAPASDGETVPLCLTAGGAKRHPRNPRPPRFQPDLEEVEHRVATLNLSEVLPVVGYHPKVSLRSTIGYTHSTSPRSRDDLSEPSEMFPRAAGRLPNPRKRSREPRRAFRTPGNVPASRGELSEPSETFPRAAAGFPNPRKRSRKPRRAFRTLGNASARPRRMGVKI